MTTKSMSKIHELFKFDADNAVESNSSCIIGTDEAGRGPGAGPVFAAAVCFSDIDDELMEQLVILNDSKQLSEKHREELFEIIINNSVYSIKEGSVEDIEKKNILNTSLDCMNKSCTDVIRQLNCENCLILADGDRLIKNFKFPQKTVVKGDSKSAAIAAASILAKVSRDRFMETLSTKYPQYNWAKNKGYLTKEHIEALKQYGSTRWHRAKFIRNILEHNNTSQLGLF